MIQEGALMLESLMSSKAPARLLFPTQVAPSYKPRRSARPYPAGKGTR